MVSTVAFHNITMYSCATASVVEEIISLSLSLSLNSITASEPKKASNG